MDSRINSGLGTVLAVVSVFVVCSAGYTVAYNRGMKEGQSLTESAVKATCDNPETKTRLGDADYLCVDQEHWNAALNYVFKQGFAAGRAAQQKEL